MIEPKNHTEYCPHCGQSVRLYTWTLLDSMVHALHYLARITSPTGRFLRLNDPGVPDSIKRSRSFPKLRHWGLIEAGQRGEWRPTQLGLDFLSGKIDMPKNVFVYNNEKRGQSDERITVEQARGERFDYVGMVG